MPKTDIIEKPERPVTENFGWIALAGSILSWFVLALGAGTAGFALVLIVRSFSPVLFVDQWTLPGYLRALHHLPLAWFWEQHNEHRLPILKAIQLMDLYWFGGHNILLVALSVAVVAAHASFLVYMVRRVGGFSAAAARFLAGAALFCIFCPNQWENFVCPFDLTNLMAYGGASVAVGGLILLREGVDAGHPKKRLLALSMAAAWVAECSVAAGLFLWPVLVVEAWILRLSGRVQLVLAATGVAAAALFLIGWQSVQGSGRLGSSLAHPVDVFHYLILYLGAGWRQVDPHLTGGMGLCGLLLMGAIGLWVLARRPAKPLAVYGAAMGAFLLGTGLLTALGRISFGLEQAFVSRYQTAVMLFWWALLAAALAALWKADREWILLPMAGLAAASMLAAATGFPAVLDGCIGRKGLLGAARMAIQINVRDDQYIADIFPDPTVPFDGYHFLWSQGLALPGPDPWGLVGVPLTSRYTMAPRDACTGRVDTVAAIGGTELVTGWAWSRNSRTAAEGILFADSRGSIVGSGVASLPRQEVRSAVPEVTAANVGWHGYIRNWPDAAGVHPYAILPGGRSACELEQSVVPPIPAR